MRMSALFGLTLREAPSGAEVAGHGLLLRAGYIRQLAAGIFSYLPLAKRSIGKIEKILREEMDAACGKAGVRLLTAAPRLCTDNAAMIAFAASLRFASGFSSQVTQEIDPNLALA